MKYLRLAFSFLTVLPVKVKEAPQPGDLGRAAVWYPLVGAIIGSLVWLAKAGLTWLFPPMLAAGVCVVVWILLSGALHLDGLADCCDGLLNASSRERRLEIMKDPRLGTFGGVGLVLAILLKVLAVLSLPPGSDLLAIVLATSLGRWMILLAGKQPLARPGGMGADFALGLTPRAFLGAAVLPLVLMVLGGWHGLAAAAAAHLAAVGVMSLARARLGGMTGDVLGLLVEVTELVVLLSFAVR